MFNGVKVGRTKIKSDNIISSPLKIVGWVHLNLSFSITSPIPCHYLTPALAITHDFHIAIQTY